ncbi:hypothetical protein HPB51_003377 [Rhipicephalus microplus]|uniref:ZSWIM3 N-terminal domain-containing protein n=1 Tax=Rhipicephalus microplus TaxID=6941 RepID=A0A9J6D3Y6_RHIMP|nr:hypothetical protein HPB51_003377 [Rhipicephalus microplus]
MAIEVGATLNTFEEFRKALSDFQINNNVLFVTKATKKVEVVNARLSVGLERLDSKLKYANATYICKHGGVKRCSGTGIRPRQRTMKQECPATIVVAARRASQTLEITKADLNHNHEVSSQIFSFYPETRRLSSEEQEYVLPLMEMNKPPSVVASKLHETTGK